LGLTDNTIKQYYTTTKGKQMKTQKWAQRMADIMAETDEWKVDCLISELKTELTGEEPVDPWFEY
jgi:hypothetical protein